MHQILVSNDSYHETQLNFKYWIILYVKALQINTFYATGLFLYPLKTSEKPEIF